MKGRKIPFEFVVETLARRSPVIRPMFGCYAIYVGEKMMLILRDSKEHTFDNGVWIATSEEYHSDLKKLFPSMRTVRVLGKKTAWQNLPKSADDFEECAMKACELILQNDPRIGKIPKRKKKKSRLGSAE